MMHQGVGAEEIIQFLTFYFPTLNSESSGLMSQVGSNIGKH